MTETVKTEELARWLGVSAVRVRDLAREGVIPKKGRSAFELQPCVVAYCAHLRKQAAKAGGRPPADGSPINRTARERLTEAQAELAEIKAKAARGELVEASAVAAEWAGVLRDVRAGVLAIPSRVGSQLGHLTPHDLDTIDRELRDVLAELADA